MSSLVRRFRLAALLSGLTGAALAVDRAGNAADPAADALAREIFKQLIGINTTDSVGNVTTAAEAMAQRFLAAGFPAADVVVAGPEERKKNLVVRLRGTGKHRPVLLIGHLDVVEARREDWSTDPFELIEKDGYFYGRGTSDMKDGDAIMATTLLRLKREGYRPSRDVILALTADEEGGCCNGPEWLLKNHRELVDAEFVLNHDGSSILSEHGVPRTFTVGGTQKVYADYQLTVTNRGGHSSLPRPDNAIYQLADGLLKMGHYQFPFELNSVTRAYFERMAATTSGETAADMRASRSRASYASSGSGSRRMLESKRSSPSISSSARGTIAWRFLLKRRAKVRRVNPKTQATNGASPRYDSMEEKTLKKTSWTVSSVSARLCNRFSR